MFMHFSIDNNYNNRCHCCLKHDIFDVNGSLVIVCPPCLLSTVCLSVLDERGHVHPHRQHRVGVGVDVHGEGKLHVAGLVTVHSRGVDGLHDGVHVCEWHVDRETRHLE